MPFGSILSLLGKRPKNGKQTIDVPDVAPSSSGEEYLSPTASMDVESIAMVNTTSTPPPTPPALKPRASIHDIRNQLGIPTLLPLSTNEVSMTSSGMPVLPPRLSCAVNLSPQISNSSFYSKSSQFCDHDRIAASPNLKAPTTAVGALFAQSQSKSVSFFRDENDDKYRPVLPPRQSWFNEDSADEIQYQRLDDDLEQNDIEDDQSSIDNPAWTTLSETSFSSHTGLVNEPPRRYDFDPILQLNVSAISGNMTDQSSLERDDDEQGSILLTRKNRNQQSQKERLVLDCIERMMENLTLLNVQGTTDSAAPVDLNGEGLLEGFSERNLRQIQQHLKSILRELDTARPEEFFLSPTQMEQYGETHVELRHAMEFVLQVLALEPMDAWELKFEMRASLGLVSLPDSPTETVRGGDTSLFTLPEENATPHTSNVSMATTITSKPTTPEKKDSPFRRTFEILGSLVQKLSQACKALTESKLTAQTTIRATEEMKRLYLSIMTLKNSDLMVVADAFFLARPLIRAVSLEGEDECIPPPPCVTLQQESARLNLLHAFDGHVQSSASNRIMMEHDNDERNKENYSTNEDDDLRRLVGSNDYDCNDTRDEPDDDEMERDLCHDFYQPSSNKVCKI